MFAFHSIGRQDENFLKSDDERLKDFRSRLQYLARGVQGYIKKLKEFLAKPTPGTSPDDIKIKQIALRTNENIQVRGSFYIQFHFFLLENLIILAGHDTGFIPLPSNLQSKYHPIIQTQASKQSDRIQARGEEKTDHI